MEPPRKLVNVTCRVEEKKKKLNEKKWGCWLIQAHLPLVWLGSTKTGKNKQKKRWGGFTFIPVGKEVRPGGVSK